MDALAVWLLIGLFALFEVSSLLFGADSRGRIADEHRR